MAQVPGALPTPYVELELELAAKTRVWGLHHWPERGSQELFCLSELEVKVKETGKNLLIVLHWGWFDSVECIFSSVMAKEMFPKNKVQLNTDRHVQGPAWAGTQHHRAFRSHTEAAGHVVSNG